MIGGLMVGKGVDFGAKNGVPEKLFPYKPVPWGRSVAGTEERV
jgi:hypothetical protein